MWVSTRAAAVSSTRPIPARRSSTSRFLTCRTPELADRADFAAAVAVGAAISRRSKPSPHTLPFVSATCSRITVRRLAAITLTLMLLGCSASAVEPAPTPPTGTAAPHESRLGLVRATVDALVRTARAGDRAGFYRLVSEQDPSFHDRARLLYDNLSTLPLTRLQVRMEPTEFALSDARRKAL